MWRGCQSAPAPSGRTCNKDQIVFPSEVLRHRAQRFPIQPLVINAEPAPRRLVGEDLVQQRRDARARLARARVARDEPATAEVFARPDKATESCDDPFSLALRQQDEDHQRKQPCASDGESDELY